MNVEQMMQTQTIVLPANNAIGASQAKTADVASVAEALPVPATPAKQPVDTGSLKAAAEQIDSFLKSTGRNLDIHVDKDTGEMVVTVRDAETGEVIRQIPNEETIRLAKVLNSQANPSSAILDLSA